jgi:hypothetical protein
VTYDDMIAVIQAAKDGAAIECARMSAYYAGKRNGPWTKCKTKNIIFNFQNYTYRVAPEVRDFTIVLDSAGNVVGGTRGGLQPGMVVPYNVVPARGALTTLHVREVMQE